MHPLQFLIVSKQHGGTPPAAAAPPPATAAPKPRPPEGTVLRRWERVYAALLVRAARGGNSLSVTLQSDCYANHPGGGANPRLPG